MKKTYWFSDNWYGDIKEFDSLRAAKKEAKLQTGISVTIYDEKSNIVCFAPASGHTPS